MEVIDGQLHEPGLDDQWSSQDAASQETILSEALHTMMTAVGVDGAVLHPVESIDWALSMAESEPRRFAVVPMVARPHSPIRDWWDSRRWDSIDPDAPDLEERLESVALHRGVVGFRMFVAAEMDPAPSVSDGHQRVLRFCERRQLVVFLAAGGRLDLVRALAQQFSALRFALDQMGLYAQPDGPADQWALVPEIVQMAELPNLVLKLTGLPAFSRCAYPFEDIRTPFSRILDAYGPARCIWASDISQYQGRVGWGNRFPVTPGLSGKHTYAESLAFLREASWLDDRDKALLLGGTARRVLSWPHGV